jgi:hypothetical protein
MSQPQISVIGHDGFNAARMIGTERDANEHWTGNSGEVPKAA